MNITDTQNILERASRQFETDVLSIHRDILTMGCLVTKQITRGISAMVNADPALGEQVIADDHKINFIRASVDEMCLHILARRQPSVRDLRQVKTMEKIITELDHMNNEANHIATRATELSRQFSIKNQFTDFAHFGSSVEVMVHEALGVFARMDLPKAIDVLQTNKGICSQYESIVRQQITYMNEDPRAAYVCLSILCAAHALVCVSNSSDAVCRYVIYFASGKDMRHSHINAVKRLINAIPTDINPVGGWTDYGMLSAYEPALITQG